jgi:hypothetical protein
MRALRSFSLAASLWLAITPTTSVGEETIKWGSVGQWEIRVDPTIGNGCFTYMSWTGGTIFRIGITPEEGGFQFFLGNQEWESLEVGKKYNIEIQFGRKTKWEIEATGSQIGGDGLTFLYAQGEKTKFITEFMEQTNMRIFYGDKEIDNLNLSKSYAAILEVIRCQKMMNEPSASRSNSDPFSASRSRATDPFSN